MTASTTFTEFMDSLSEESETTKELRNLAARPGDDSSAESTSESPSGSWNAFQSFEAFRRS